MKKTMLIVAAVLTVLGLALFAGAFAASGWDLTKLSTGKTVTNTYTPNETFRDIEIRTDEADIMVIPTEDGSCTVTCMERERERHTVTVEDGTLKITAEPRKGQVHFGLFLSSPIVWVALPADTYRALLIETDTGMVSIPLEVSFETVGINADTGFVIFNASASGPVKIHTDTGDISVENIHAGALDLSASTGTIRVTDADCDGDLTASVSTGRTELTDVTCASLVSTGGTGSITLKDVVAAGSMTIDRDTGDVRFDNSDAAAITVKTDTGDVTGTLRTEKVFITKTDTGSVRVPDTDTGGRCEITTDTGDIRIELTAR